MCMCMWVGFAGLNSDKCFGANDIITNVVLSGFFFYLYNELAFQVCMYTCTPVCNNTTCTRSVCTCVHPCAATLHVHGKRSVCTRVHPCAGACAGRHWVLCVYLSLSMFVCKKNKCRPTSALHTTSMRTSALPRIRTRHHVHSHTPCMYATFLLMRICICLSYAWALGV